MASPFNKNIFWILVVFAAVMLVGSSMSMFGGQGLTLIGSEVSIPAYMRAECSERTENLQQSPFEEIPKSGKFYSCTTDASGTYIPIVNGVQCRFHTQGTAVALTSKVCDSDAQDEDHSSCRDPQEIEQAGSRVFIVNSGDKLWLNPTSFLGLGTEEISPRYPAYGLKVVTSTNYGFPQTTSCELNSLSRQYHTIDAGERTEVVPGVPFNVVTEKRKAVSSQNVILEGVNNGNPLYITRPGYYYQIKEAEDGFLYVDTSGGEKQSNKIECIPRTTGCSDDAKITKLEDQSCGTFDLGAITGYAPVQGDNTNLCKYVCGGDNTLKKTSDCISVQSDCPDDKPLWDGATGQCVEVEPREDEEEFDFTILIIVAVFAVIILVMFYIKSRNKKVF